MINHLRGDFGGEPVRRELDLSVSAFNARRRRPKSARRTAHRRHPPHPHHLRRDMDERGLTTDGSTASYNLFRREVGRQGR